MRLKLITPNGEIRQLDTPDPALIGLWLKMWFDHWAPDTVSGRGPVTFTLEMY